MTDRALAPPPICSLHMVRRPKRQHTAKNAAIRIQQLITSASFALVVLCLPAVASGVPVASRRNQRTDGRNRTPSRSAGSAVLLASTLTAKEAVDVSACTSNKTNQAWLNGLKNAAASSCAAACCKTLLQPIDAIKTVQQYHPGQGSLSVVEAARQLLSRSGGFANFYAGLGVTVIGAMPSVGLYFGVYSYCKQRFLATKMGRQHATVSIALAAAMGNTVASFSRVPYEVAKQKLQAGLYDSTWALFRDLTKPGLAAELLFPKGGVWSQMIRDVPYAVVTLLLYESLQQHFGGSNNSSSSNQRTAVVTKSGARSSAVRDAVLGGFAGGVGSWVTNPADVIKTRLQTDTAKVYGGSVVACGRAVWNEGGSMAFLRGSLPRLVHKVPANAMFFLFYELFKRMLAVEEGGATGIGTVANERKQGA